MDHGESLATSGTRVSGRGMNADDYKKLKDIFQAAVELPPEERSAYLDERCPDDPDIRAEIDRLLNSYESSFLEDPAVGVLGAALDSGLQSGATIGHYRILSKIGSGGMGEVYLAEDGKLGRRVAIKLLPETLTEDEDRLRRFEQEARTASALNHPNILTVFEIGDIGKTLYIATEYIDGETLRSRLNRGRLSVSESLEIAIQCASALVAAHEEGIIHRDIKPENIMLRRDGLVKVLDFGLAKLSPPAAKPAGPDIVHDATTERHVHTAPGVIMGTVQYMSPEQTRGRATDPRTDIWSLGCVLYEMLAGRAPFVGESSADLIAEIVKVRPAPFSNGHSDIPQSLSNLVDRMLEKEAEARYQSSGELVSELKALRRDLEVRLEIAHVTRLSLEQTGTCVTPGYSECQARSVIISGKHFTLVGRHREISQLRELILMPQVRLVTLTGLGGTGKTTIARVVADEIRSSFQGDVVFVELASVAHPDNVLSAIFQALHLKEAGNKPNLEVLIDYLRENATLLVLDNFEHVVAAAWVLRELTDNVLHVKLLVTSRVLLALSFETEMRIGSLEVPDLSVQSTLEQLSQNESVRLFFERARAADQSFILTNDNARSIAAICRNLDGLPLAIELAAARIRILSPEAILDRLDRRLSLLTGGGKDLPVRHQSVRATVDWSYGLLSEDEQTIFRRLAVFKGGFTITAAESVVGPVGDSTLDGIASLLNASLIVKTSSFDDEPRFRMLEVVREYAVELYEASNEVDTVRRRHAAFFLAMGEEAEEHLRAAQSAEWFDRLERENDNLRAVLSWSLERDIETATRLSAKIPMFWIQRGLLTEGQRWLQASMAVDNCERDPTLRCRQLMGLGVLSRFQGDPKRAESLFREALSLGVATNDHLQVAWSKRHLGELEYSRGDFEESARHLEASLAINRRLNETTGIAFTLAGIGRLDLARGAFELARRHLEESLEILRSLDNKAWISLVSFDLGAIAYQKSDWERAHFHFKEAIVTALELRFQSSISHALDGMAALAVRHSDLSRAARLSSAADKLRISIGYQLTDDDRAFIDSYLSRLRSTLSEQEFLDLWANGRTLKTEEAVDLALEVNIGSDGAR